MRYGIQGKGQKNGLNCKVQSVPVPLIWGGQVKGIGTDGKRREFMVMQGKAMQGKARERNERYKKGK